jgi:hypothetical protein
MFRRLPFIPLFMLLLLVIANACSGSDQTKRVGLAEGCSINSDCDSPLICAFSRCRLRALDRCGGWPRQLRHGLAALLGHDQRVLVETHAVNLASF